MASTPRDGTTFTPQPLSARKPPHPQIAQMKRTMYFLSRNTLAMVGLGIIIFFAAVALYSPFYPAQGTTLALYCGSTQGPINGCIQLCTYYDNNPSPAPGCLPVSSLTQAYIAPTVNWAHLNGGPLPLGSLALQPSTPYFYNTYAGLIKGAPWSIGISVSIVGAGAGIGLLLGSISGFKGGYTDEVIMRITDIFLSIPGLLFVLITLTVLTANAGVDKVFAGIQGRVVLLILAFIVIWWPFYTRIVRGQVLVTREQKFVEASRASGASSWRSISKHIIPNSMFPVFVQMSLDVGSIPLLLGGLVFLGFRIFPSAYFAEWGSIAAIAATPTGVQSAFLLCQVASRTGTACVIPWWQFFFPGLTLFLFAISVNLLSDGLRDALDPRLRR